MKTTHVVVLPYDPKWKDDFTAIQTELEAALGDLALGTDKPDLQLHHLYVCPANSKELHRHLVFREFLRQNPEAVKRYSAVKEQAARLFPEDIEGYMGYKAPCIEELYRLCGLEP